MIFLVKQHKEPSDNLLRHSVLHFLVPHIPPRLHCIDQHQRLMPFQHFSLTSVLAKSILEHSLWHSHPAALGLVDTPCHFSSSMSESLSASHSSSLSFVLPQSLSQWSQFSESEMLSGVVSWSLFAVSWSILVIRRTFNTWLRPPGRWFAAKAGGTGDLSDNLNIATPSCWEYDQDALTTFSVSEMYLTGVICMFRVRDSFCVVQRSWLPCHISEKSWTMAILCNVLSSTSRLISKSDSVFAISNAGSSPAIIPWLAKANYLATTVWRGVSPVVLDSPQPITSPRRDILASTWTPCGMIENMLHAALKISAYCRCVASCWHHQSVISGIQNVLLISTWLEWYSFRIGFTCPQFCCNPRGEFELSLMAVNKCAAQLLCPSIISATLFGIKYSSSLLDRS